MVWHIYFDNIRLPLQNLLQTKSESSKLGDEMPLRIHSEQSISTKQSSHAIVDSNKKKMSRKVC